MQDMTKPAEFYREFADFKGISYPEFTAFLKKEVAEHGLPLEEVSEGEMRCVTPIGSFSVFSETGHIRLAVEAERQDFLEMIREGLVEHLHHHMPEVSKTLRWSSAIPSGSLPVNFRFTEAVSVTPVGEHFLRVKLKGADLEPFADGPMHFRIVLPQPGDDAPEWPHVNENGRVIWPEGDKALHRPVYTTRFIDAEAGVLEFDVFVHEGGRATTWAQSLQAGDQVAIIGPGGGTLVTAPHMLPAGDETAYPGLARLLDNLAEDVRGDVVLYGENPGAYPLPDHPGFNVKYLKRGEDDFVAELKAYKLPEGEVYLWIAGEKGDAQPLRAHFRESCGVSTQLSYIAGFWNA